jgi:hypothetical protein
MHLLMAVRNWEMSPKLLPGACILLSDRVEQTLVDQSSDMSAFGQERYLLILERLNETPYVFGSFVFSEFGDART